MTDPFTTRCVSEGYALTTRRVSEGPGEANRRDGAFPAFPGFLTVNAGCARRAPRHSLTRRVVKEGGSR